MISSGGGKLLFIGVLYKNTHPGGNRVSMNSLINLLGHISSVDDFFPEGKQGLREWEMKRANFGKVGEGRQEMESGGGEGQE